MAVEQYQWSGGSPVKIELSNGEFEWSGGVPYSLLGGKSYEVTITENIGLSDAMLGSGEGVRSISESVGLSDALSYETKYSRPKATPTLFKTPYAEKQSFDHLHRVYRRKDKDIDYREISNTPELSKGDIGGAPNIPDFWTVKEWTFDAVRIYDSVRKYYMRVLYGDTDSAHRDLTLEVEGGDRNVKIEDDSIIDQDLTEDSTTVTHGGMTLEQQQTSTYHNIDTYSDAGFGGFPQLRMRRSGGNTIGVYGNTVPNDVFGHIQFYGSDTSQYLLGSEIKSVQALNLGASYADTNLELTTYDNSGTAVTLTILYTGDFDFDNNALINVGSLALTGDLDMNSNDILNVDDLDVTTIANGGSSVNLGDTLAADAAGVNISLLIGGELILNSDDGGDNKIKSDGDALEIYCQGTKAIDLTGSDIQMNWGIIMNANSIQGVTDLYLDDLYAATTNITLQNNMDVNNKDILNVADIEAASLIGCNSIDGGGSEITVNDRLTNYVALKNRDWIPHIYGNDDDVYVTWSQHTTPTSHYFQVALDNTYKNMVLGTKANWLYEYQHSASSNPTLFIHSNNQSTTEWISVSDDGTDGVIATGAGDLKFSPAGGNVDIDSNNLVNCASIGNGGSEIDIEDNLNMNSNDFFAGATGKVYIGASGSNYYVWNTDLVEANLGDDTTIFTWGSDGIDLANDLIFTGAGEGLCYGSLYLHEGAANVDISTAGQGVYVKITGFDAGLMNNVSENSDAFNVGKVGVYKVDWSVSGDSAGNNKIYEIDIFVNGVEQSDGSARKEFGSLGSLGVMSGTAILDITNTGHDIDIRMKEPGAGAGTDFDIFNMSFNIVQIGGT